MSNVAIRGQSGWEPLANTIPWNSYIKIRPTAKQLAFCWINCLEAFYGGAAGGGKSIALLTASLQYVNVPSYAAIIFRRQFTDLALPGALMDVANEWLSQTDAHWDDDRKTWEFPSGATLTFGYLDSPRDKFRYQSSAFQFVGFDELTQFPAPDYLYLFSRLRRTADSKIPLRVRATSNPGGDGHEWVKQRFIIEGRDHGRIFIPAGLVDNPYLDQEEYVKSLDNLDPVVKAQLLKGDWDIGIKGMKFQRGWFEIVDAAPTDCRLVRRWDMASTEPKPGKNPDWTAGCLMGVSRSTKTIYILDMKHFRGTPGANENLVKQTAELDGRAVSIRMEQEPGSSGVKVIDDYLRRVLMGWNFAGVPSTGDKEVRAAPFSSQAEAGNVKLVRGRWINDFLNELEMFPVGDHDDQVDAASGAFFDLTGPMVSFDDWMKTMKNRANKQSEMEVIHGS